MFMEDSKLQREIDTYVNNEVLYNQTMLVIDLLEKGTFVYEDIINLYKTEEELLDEGYTKEQIESGDADDVQEIFQWFVVTDSLSNRLEERHEPILRNEYGAWWGRTCCGQAISMDSVIIDIYKSLNK